MWKFGSCAHEVAVKVNNASKATINPGLLFMGAVSCRCSGGGNTLRYFAGTYRISSATSAPPFGAPAKRTYATFSALTVSSNDGMGSAGSRRCGTVPGSAARSRSLPSLSWASTQAFEPTVPQRTSVTEEAPPLISALTGMACSLAMALRIPFRSVLRWGKNVTRAGALLRRGGEGRANVTFASVHFGTGLPTVAVAKVRTTSPAAFFGGGGASLGRAVDAAAESVMTRRMIRGFIIGFGRR